MLGTLKIFAVVLVSALVGWLGTAAICARVLPAGAQEPVITPPDHLTKPEPPHEESHASISFDTTNHGGPGVLELHGQFQVEKPAPEDANLPTLELDVCLRIGDENGRLLMPLIKIDHVTVRPGVGHWSKDLVWVLPLDPGTYSVGVYAGNEEAMPRNTADDPEGACFTGSRRLMTVE